MRSSAATCPWRGRAPARPGRGPLEDTAAVLSRYVHAIVLRTFAQESLERLARGRSIPVINALSDYSHPCQALADLQTIRERKGRLAGLRLAYLGDGNNVAHSLLFAGSKMGMHVAVATPLGCEPIPQVVRRATEILGETGGSVELTHDPATAAKDANVLYTDVWASMNERWARRAGPDLQALPAVHRHGDGRRPGRHGAALPARPPGRGDRRRRGLGQPPTRPCSTRPRTASTPRRRCCRSCSPAPADELSPEGPGAAKGAPVQQGDQAAGQGRRRGWRWAVAAGLAADRRLHRYGHGRRRGRPASPTSSPCSRSSWPCGSGCCWAPPAWARSWPRWSVPAEPRLAVVAVGLGVPLGPLLVLRLDRVRDFGLAASLLTVAVMVAWGVVRAALAAGWWARPARRSRAHRPAGFPRGPAA